LKRDFAILGYVVTHASEGDAVMAGERKCTRTAAQVDDTCLHTSGNLCIIIIIIIIVTDINMNLKKIQTSNVEIRRNLFSARTMALYIL